jgi:D-galactarolactone isomerase
MVARRTFIKGASLAVLVASTSRIYVRDGLAQQAPNSSGTEPAKLKAPAGACDCHHHIYDAARFPVRAGSRVVPNARVEDYRLLQKRTGTSRNIVVTPIGLYSTSGACSVSPFTTMVRSSFRRRRHEVCVGASVARRN